MGLFWVFPHVAFHVYLIKETCEPWSLIPPQKFALKSLEKSGRGGVPSLECSASTFLPETVTLDSSLALKASPHQCLQVNLPSSH